MSFGAINDKKTIWIFHHGCHANPSNTKFSQIANLLEIQTEDNHLICSESHDHFLLDSFFYDNTALIRNLQQQLRCMDENNYYLPKLEESLERVTKFVAEPEVDRCVVHPYSYKFKANENVFSIDGNTWTKRLVGSLKNFISDEVTYTGDIRDFRVNFSGYSSISEGSIGSHVSASIFRGTPDIIIKKDHPVVVTYCDDDGGDANMSIEEISPEMISSGDSDYFIVKQQNAMTAVSHGLPEKLGELVANMWWIATAKVIKRILKGKEVDETIVEGFLLDKAHGAIHLKVTFHLNNTQHTLTVLSCTNGILLPSVLCKLFRN